MGQCSECGRQPKVPRKSRCIACQRAADRRYERTPQGFLVKAYRNMRARVLGIQKNRAHIYKGLPILPKAQFYEWARNNPEFWRLHRLWVASNYNLKLAPSINRIDASQGYLLGNIEITTHSINSSLHRHRHDAVLQRIYASVVAA